MDISALVTALTQAFTGFANEAVDFISAAAPIAIGVGGVFIVIRLGWKTFKSLVY